ncbi:MAG TPA: hypothetical protein VKT29_08065 [Terriglobales bacterium]|nr:hypothetical protein [Terriglobales bacterium]
MVQQGKPWSFAHVLGVLGFLMSAASLLWQVSIYRDSFKQRVLVRLSAVEVLNPSDLSPRKGTVAVEVVNMGQHPLYVRQVSVTAPCLGIDGKRQSNAASVETSKQHPIEPGAATTYQITGWNSPLDDPSEVENLDNSCVNVDSNKGPVSVSSLGFSGGYSFETAWQRVSPATARKILKILKSQGAKGLN